MGFCGFLGFPTNGMERHSAAHLSQNPTKHLQGTYFDGTENWHHKKFNKSPHFSCLLERFQGALFELELEGPWPLKFI